MNVVEDVDVSHRLGLVWGEREGTNLGVDTGSLTVSDDGDTLGRRLRCEDSDSLTEGLSRSDKVRRHKRTRTNAT